jgi:hypothetical protein
MEHIPHSGNIHQRPDPLQQRALHRLTPAYLAALLQATSQVQQSTSGANNVNSLWNFVPNTRIHSKIEHIDPPVSRHTTTYGGQTQTNAV